MIYVQLFLSFVQIGLFSFGGGYAAMPLIQHQVVIQHSWLSMHEFTDLVTISQMTPGPIAINAATFVGIRIAGLGGAAAATAGCVTPSCIIVSLIAVVYFHFRHMEILQHILSALRPAVISLIASAGVSILITALWKSKALISFAGTRWNMAVIFFICIFLLRKTKWNPIFIILLAGGIKLGLALIVRAA